MTPRKEKRTGPGNRGAHPKKGTRIIPASAREWEYCPVRPSARAEIAHRTSVYGRIIEKVKLALLVLAGTAFLFFLGFTIGYCG